MLSKDNFLKKFGSKVKEARMETKMSQESLAAEAKLHRNYIGRLERGEACPSIYVIYKISAALKTQIVKIIPEL